jgi:hypothetical protein
MPFEFSTDYSDYFDDPSNNDINNLTENEIQEEDFKPWDFEPLDKEQKDKKKKLPKNVLNMSKNDILKIVPYPTNKHKIKQRPMMEADIIPRHASSVIFNGRSGSGKSNLLINLLTRPCFYGPQKEGEKSYFDLIFLFSPTAHGGDDLVQFLNLPPKRIDTTLDTKKLDHILETQQKLIETKGLLKSPKILIIFDDCQSDAKFLSTKSFLRCFIQCRHLNISTFLCGQRFNKTPKACRLQANNIFFFPASDGEIDLMVDEYTPANMTKKKFKEIIQFATEDRYNFLHINLRVKDEERFRKNLDEIININ